MSSTTGGKQTGSSTDSKQQQQSTATTSNAGADACTVFAEAPKCNSFPTFVESISTPLKQMIQQGTQSASDKYEQILAAINALPVLIRHNTLFTSKVIGGNIKAFSDTVAGEADSKTPPVTKDNYEIYKFLKSKQAPLVGKIVEFSEKHKDLPIEKRVYSTIAFANENLKPIVLPPAKPGGGK